ncbi:MAG: hypothetical protein IKE03_06030 [Blautia sp.]|nr:hypothetical protein [Blautia sp.]
MQPRSDLSSRWMTETHPKGVLCVCLQDGRGTCNGRLRFRRRSFLLCGECRGSERLLFEAAQACGVCSGEAGT